jgi:hypothetical protein
MTGFTGQVWALLAAIAAAGILSLLHYIAASVRNATYIHDLRVRVAAIRKDQSERLQALADAADAAELEARSVQPKTSMPPYKKAA